MTILANPYRFRLGADTGVGRFLGDEPSGVAVDFTTMTALIRDADAPLTQYFGNAASLLTYTAPSTKWIYDINGLLVSGNTLRIDYDPVTHEPKGVLSELTKVNIVLWNRDLTNAVWVKTNITAAKDQTGLDGVANSASSIMATAANATVLQSVTVAVNTRMTSAFVKRLVGTGTIEATHDNGATWTVLPVTSAWVRFSNPSSSVTNPVIGIRIATSGDKIAVDFVQNEIGTYITSPIATTTAAVTRAYDNISMPVTAFPYNPAATTLFAAGILRQVPASACSGAQISDGTTNSRISVYLTQSGYVNSQVSMINAASPQVSITLAPIVALGSEVRVGIAVELNNAAGKSNGSILSVDTSCTIPTVTTFYMSGTHTSAESLNGWLRRVKYLPRRVSNTELAQMVA